MSSATAIRLESDFRTRAQLAAQRRDLNAAAIWVEAADTVAKEASNPARPVGERLREQQWFRPNFAERQRIRARALGIA